MQTESVRRNAPLHPGPLLRGEGEIFAAFQKDQAAGFAGPMVENPKACVRYSLSSEERVRVRSNPISNSFIYG
jgi:hypothetical protein